MRILCCGDRDWTNIDLILETLWDYKNILDVVIIHGAARGADFLCGKVAKELGFKVEEYPADWKRYKTRAGILRNIKMLESKPDHVIAFHNSIEMSKGTKHMIYITKKAEISFEIKVNNEKT